MKRILIFFATILLVTFSINSCGDSEVLDEKISLPDPPTNIKYEGVELIDGPFSGFVEVVPGEYTLNLTKNEDKFLLGYSGTMKVKFRFLKSLDVKSGSGYNNFGPSLLGTALDDQGVPLDFNLDIIADQDLATYLKRGSGEEWLTLYISGQGSCENASEAAKQLERYKKGKKIRFNSEVIQEKFDDESSSNDQINEEEADNSDDESSSSSDDCDEFLNEYEQFMKEYIVIIKKMKSNPTDMSIMSDYSDMMSEAEEWADKTSDCEGDAKFAAKFAAIQMKIANAASGL